MRRLGVVPYGEALALQRALVEDRRAGRVPDLLLLLQHAPVITLGVRGDGGRSHITATAERLAALGVEVSETGRGGDVTFHGPGQIVGYPILKLSEHGLKPRSYLHALEAVLTEALRPFGVDAETVKGFTGLWVGRKKLASIGVAVRGGVTYHGFALNVNNSLSPFRLIHPCKLESDVMTSMHKVLGKPVDEHAVTKTLGEAMLEYFGKTASPGGAP